jgi:uncharacterized protein YbjT (DUF2867 family)
LPHQLLKMGQLEGHLARISPISASDVARVVSTILEDPTGHRGKVYELTGPQSEDMNEIVKRVRDSTKSSSEICGHIIR